MTRSEGGSVPKWVLGLLAGVLITYMVASLIWDQWSQHKNPSPFTLLQVIEAIAAAGLAYSGGKKLLEHQESKGNDKVDEEKESK
jgi:high-affinity Fe2+/Pb2+ permease